MQRLHATVQIQRDGFGGAPDVAAIGDAGLGQRLLQPINLIAQFVKEIVALPVDEEHIGDKGVDQYTKNGLLQPQHDDLERHRRVLG